MHGRRDRGRSHEMCAACGDYVGGNHRCRCSQPGVRVRVARGHVVGFAAGIVPCARCGTTRAAVSIRGWTYVQGLLLAARERRRAAYVCSACGHAETARALIFTALLGWWSVPGALVLAPRATLRNWRAVFTHPAEPGRWGAIRSEDFRRRFVPKATRSELDDRIWESPLRFLDRAQTAMVCDAEGLYELLGAEPTATVAELRAAYRARCKEVHPDLHAQRLEATERMAELNRAWEILRVPELRAAYDWLQSRRGAHDFAVAA